MLDWEDEELASILWDEVPEAVVPYPEGNERSQSAAPSKELTKEPSSHELEIKRAPDKVDSHGRGNEINSVFNSNTEKNPSCLGTEPWKDPNLSIAVKRSHYSIGTSLGSSAGTMQNVPSSGDGVARVDEGSESSQKQLEEQKNGDFIDCSWADIESFDDLDKLFSNDDLIFGSAGHGCIDELWSASQDAGYSLENSFPSPVESLISLPGSYNDVHVQTNVSNQPIPDHDNVRNCISYDPSDIDSPTDGAAYTGRKAVLKLKETRLDHTENNATLSSPNSSSSTVSKLSNKVNKPKNFKNRKSLDQKMKGKLLLSTYGNQYLPGNQFRNIGKEEATSVAHSYQFSEASQLRHITVQPVAEQASVPCENMYNPYPDMPMMPQLQYGLGGLQQKVHEYKVSPGSSFMKTAYGPSKPLFMTPQEKIDKLRRRQQMQAMLAIKKQQHELGQQASYLDMDPFMNKKYSHDTQIETACGIKNDNDKTPTIPPCFDFGCSSEKKISASVSKVVNELPAENSALTQLQDIISKLDSRVRLCIRDSLFRLAASALQRHYTSDDVSANIYAQHEDHKLAKEEISNHNREAVIVDAETQTNLIDRTVAHLLFHRPLDAIANNSEPPKLSVSTQPLPECKTDSLVILTSKCSKDNTEPQQSLPHNESESSTPTMEQRLGTEFLDNSCVDVSKNASSHEIHTEKLSTKYSLNEDP